MILRCMLSEFSEPLRLDSFNFTVEYSHAEGVISCAICELVFLKGKPVVVTDFIIDDIGLSELNPDLFQIHVADFGVMSFKNIHILEIA